MTTTPENSCRNSSFSIPDLIIDKKVSNKSLIRKIYKLFNKKIFQITLDI